MLHNYLRYYNAADSDYNVWRYAYPAALLPSVVVWFCLPYQVRASEGEGLLTCGSVLQG